MDAVRQIADAVLYEGYILWPYRRSALKNTHRFTFGGVDPHGTMRTEVLLEDGGDAAVEVSVRFLQAVRRQLCQGGEPVDELTVEGERHLSWEEATERELSLEGTGRIPIAVPAGRVEGRLSADCSVIRSWGSLEGEVSVDAKPLRPGLVRLSVEISNTTPLEGTFCSTHTILRVHGGAFVSLTDPPDELRAEAEACRNEGTWPVLVGEPGERHTMLSSRIILEEYPRVAAESPGNLFDGGEIDELLTLNILGLTDDEKAEMRATDPRAREILDRTEALTNEELMRLHGMVRP
ncbi:MAG: hypothetical protein ACRDL4_03170 [Thermoleophilaceae bacterium]